ncbi:MAG: TonB-dependent receptor plug domain-containing protein, partial [Bacteroidetes bacterium]|nr:TonB-dependent receptor plug domain-containing protein [Bacteroidota bacterium]
MRIVLSFLFFFTTTVLMAQEFTLNGSIISRNSQGIEGVLVRSPQSVEKSVFTDSKGKFSLKMSSSDSVLLYVQYDTTRLIFSYKTDVRLNQMYLAPIRMDVQQLKTVDVNVNKVEPFELDKLKLNDIQNIPLGGVERFLVYTTAATSNNELTSNYNVRGGNYDENLVYVNGFQVYRPFLTRSGQQEGMSFVNSALVQDVSFSAGGFDARYGDKLSSVLDIKYKTPKKFGASAMASLLGVEAHVEQAVGSRFSYLMGARYRANGYLLNSLPAKGAYNPIFIDGQFLTNYALTENLDWQILGHFSSNDYRFAPQTERTDFGTVNEAYSFTIYYEGQEQTRFLTAMGGTSLKYRPSKRTNLDFFATAFRSVEREYFDILGQYFINELETDPSKEEFGDSIATLGIGGFLNHGRNKLNATIFNLYHDGSHTLKEKFTDEQNLNFYSHQLRWGVNGQFDQFQDKLSEWRYLDSAGYSLPQTNPYEVELFETIKGNLALQTFRATTYFQSNIQFSKNKKNVAVEVRKKIKIDGEKLAQTFSDTLLESASKLAISTGIRAGYTEINGEFFVTPRASVTYFPRFYMYSNGKVTRRDVRFRLASGLYYQPPFYREFRTFDGQLNTNVKSQKSLHVVASSEIFVNLWGRKSPFKLSSDLYYKYLWDVNPYEIDNVRTRYFAENNAVAYAYGLDINMGGQFVDGIESYFKMGVLRTKEDVLDDFYYDYFNAEGKKIVFGFTDDDVPVDSVKVEPGYIPRPTDQMFSFGALIQDQMPNYESFSVQMGMQFGSRLPYGPPDRSRYKDTLRMKSYFRVDIGFSYDFLYKKKNNKE